VPGKRCALAGRRRLGAAEWSAIRRNNSPQCSESSGLRWCAGKQGRPGETTGVPSMQSSC
jgi:hypothetical protein